MGTRKWFGPTKSSGIGRGTKHDKATTRFHQVDMENYHALYLLMVGGCKERWPITLKLHSPMTCKSLHYFEINISD